LAIPPLIAESARETRKAATLATVNATMTEDPPIVDNAATAHRAMIKRIATTAIVLTQEKAIALKDHVMTVTITRVSAAYFKQPVVHNMMNPSLI
jgi:hypothetical protein